jgi:hypothetical protein
MKDNSKTYTYLATVAAFLQMSVPQWHLPDITSQVVSAALLAIVSIFTILKQRTSVEINNQSVMYTYILIGVAALGGVNEIIGIIHFNAQWQNVLRSVVVSLIGLLNLTSKTLFPSEAGEAIQGLKDSIKEGKTEVISNQILNK